MHRRVASRRPWLRLAAFLVCVAGCVAPSEVAAQTVSYAQFSSGFPTATHHDGTNTLTFAAALDRAGSAYYVVVRQPNGLTGGSVTEPTPAEIFAGTSSGGAVDDVFASGSLAFSSPDVDRQILVDALPDLAIYNVYVATHTGDPTVANDGVASPAAATAALLDAATIPDVTPPSFVDGAPRDAGRGPSYLTVALAASESATAHVLVLPADATPPADAAAVVAGTSPDGANAVAFHGTFSPPSSAPATNFNLTGDLFPGTRYAVYVALRDAATVPNLAPAVATLTMTTATCPECPVGRELAGSSCDCVVSLTFTLELDATATSFAANKESFRASIADQIGVSKSQLTVVRYQPSETNPGKLAVFLSVTPTSAADTATAASVDQALSGGQLSAGEELGGGADLGGVVLSGEPDTRLLATPRPRGRTSPVSDDGRIPGHLLEPPDPSSMARFRWRVWFGDTECTGCQSECMLDDEAWTTCASPKFYQNLAEGEHNFRVRGLGGDGAPDATPARFTWTIRYRVEVRFAVVPVAATKVATVTLYLGSNKNEAVFEYSVNGEGDFPTYARLPLGQDSVAVTSRLGENVFHARAVAEGETSESVARAIWVYDVHAPLTNITSDSVRNGSVVNKLSEVRFIVTGDDSDPAGASASGLASVELRFRRLSDGATTPAPLFDWTAAPLANVEGNARPYVLSDDVDVTEVDNAMYVLSARAVDAAGNYRDVDADPFGEAHYYFTLTDEVPSAATISPAVTREDTLSPVYNDSSCPSLNVTPCGVQLQITPVIAGEGEPEAYKISNVRGGQLFYPDGATEILEGSFVDKTNASAGLRFLPEKDANSLARREDGSKYVFAFDAYPSAYFNDSGVVEIPATAKITVTPVNDPPTLDRDGDYALTGVYYLDNEVTNFGDPVSRLVKVGFHDIDGPYSVALDNTGVVVVAADESRGAWEYTADYGANWTRFPADLAPDRPLLLRAGTNDRVRYRPTYPGDGAPLADAAWSASFAFRAWDVESNRSTGERGWFVSNESAAVSAADAALATPGNASSYAEAYGDANATWRWFDAGAFDAEGEISMNVATAWIEVYGLEHSAHMMGSARQTEAEHEKLRAARAAADGCPPPYGVYARVDAGDPGSSLASLFIDDATAVPDPPWTVEAWVRRDVALVSQALFTGPTGGSIALEAAPATGRLAVVVPETAAEIAAARAAFAAAENNTAADAAAARVVAAEASAKLFNHSAPVREWTHLAFVAVPDRDPYVAPGASVRLYADGVYRGAVDDAGMPMPVGTVGGPGRAALAVDHVRFWSRALTHAEIWSRRGKLASGREPGLWSYLPLDEGCGAAVEDVSATAAAENRSAWNFTAANLTWHRREEAMSCATIEAIRPAIVPASGGTTVTLHGAGFLPPRERARRSGRGAVCRFGVGGPRGGAIVVPAIATSAETAECEAPPARRGGTVASVQFCDPTTSCCSEPATLAAVARDAIRPANFTPPSDANLASAGAEHASILYRDAEVISASPRDASARAGATLTIRGWGFVDANEPGSASSPWGGRGGRGGAACEFTAWGGGAPAGVVDRTGATDAGWNGSSSPSSSPSAATSRARVSPETFTSPARIVSGGMATCELPAFPPSAVPPGATIRLLVSLRLDDGARTLAAPVAAAVELVAPDADDATFRLASDDDRDVAANAASPAAVAVPARKGDENADSNPRTVAGDAEGGAVVALVLRGAASNPGESHSVPDSEADAEAAANREDREAARAFASAGVSASVVSANDAACAFGTIRGVSARRVGARAYACVSPAAPRDDASVPLAATTFRAASRYDAVADFTGASAPGARFRWFRRAAAVHAGPAAIVSASRPSDAARDPREGELHVFADGFPSSPTRVATCRFAGGTSARNDGRSVPASDPSDDARAAANASVASDGLGAVRCAWATTEVVGVGFVAVSVGDSIGDSIGGGGGARSGSGSGALSGSGWSSTSVVVVSARADLTVTGTINDPGPASGGWLVFMRGVGFLPGDGCAFDRLAVPGRRVSSAMLTCEVPALDPELDPALDHALDPAFDHALDPADVARDWVSEPVLARSATPGGWDGGEMVPAGGGGVAVRPARTPRALSFAPGVASAVVAETGGSSIVVYGEGLAARGAEDTTRPECRVRAVDVAARPAPGERDVAPGPGLNPRGVGALECVSPAVARASPAGGGDVVPFAIAASTVPGRIGAEKMPANRDVVLAPNTNVPGAVGVVAAGEPAPPAGASRRAIEIVAASLASREEAATAETDERRVLATYDPHADGHGRLGLACFVASEDASADVHAFDETTVVARTGTGAGLFSCGARARGVGFATVHVALARRGVRVRGAPPAAIVEFEFAPLPTLRNVATHAGLVPGRVVDVNAAFWIAADARRGFFVASSSRTKPVDGSSRWTSADGSEGTDADNVIVVAADADGGPDEDDADVGGAWWHAGGAGAGVAPVHVLGTEFKPGEGLRARFANGGTSPEARRAVLVRAHFVSSALVKVEQPATEAEVRIDVSVNGGVSFSDVAVAYREEIPA